MADLAGLIAKQGSDLRLRQAIVTAVPSGGTCTIRFGDLASTTAADDIAGVHHLVNAAFVNGDTVWVLQTGGSLLVIGKVGAGDTGWLTLSLANGWVSYDNNYGPPAYRKIGSVVYLRGLAKGGTITNGTVIATLPVGFRTSLTKLRAITTSNEAFAQVDISSDGNIYIATGANAQYFSLNLPPFPVD